jgi:26S proteasome regulatory subunit T1
MVTETKEKPADKKKEAKEDEIKDEDNKPIRALTEEDIRVMQAYGAGPYTSKIKELETELKDLSKKVNEIAGIKESDTGLAHPSRWDLVSDKQMMQEEAPLSVRNSLLASFLVRLTFDHQPSI